MWQKVDTDKVIVAPFGPEHVARVARFMADLPDGWGEKALSEIIDSPVYKSFVALYEGDIAGFCCYRTADAAELVFLLTAPAYKRQGVAFKLIRQTARLFDSVVLEVRSGNTPALSLYKKLGFKEIGVRKNMYSAPAEDGVVMEYKPGE